MSDDINLIPKQKKESAVAKKNVSTFRIVATIFVVVIAVLSVGVFLLRITSPLNSLKKQENDLLSSLVAMKDKTVEYSLLSNKIKDISDIVTGRPDLQDAIETLQEQIPADIVIGSVSIDSTGKTFKVDLSTGSLTSVDTLLNNMEVLTAKKSLVKKVVLDGFVSNPVSGSYTFSLSADLL